MRTTLTILIALTLATSAQGAAVLIDHYEFEGNADDSATANDADANNGTVGTNVTFTTGAIGQGAKLARGLAVDDHITVAALDAFNPGSGDFSIAYWVQRLNPADDVFEQTMDTLSGTSTGYQTFFLDNTGGNKHRFRLDGAGVTTANLDTVASFADTDFHHITLVVDRGGNTATYYVDGAFDSSHNIAGVIGAITPSQPLQFINLDGVIDDVRFYTGLLSTSEVDALANPSSIPTPAALPVGLVLLGGLAMRRVRRS